MDEQDRMLVETETGGKVMDQFVDLDSTHEAQTEAINQLNSVGTENDLIERKRR